MIDPALQHTAALALFLVFAGAAATKMAAWAELPGVVSNYRLLPGSLVASASWALPPVELALALAVLAGPLRAAAGAGMLLLLAAFAAAIGINVARGRTDIDCGCFGSALKQTLSWWLVLRNALLMLPAVACMLPAGTRALAGADGVTIAAGAVSLFLAYLATGYVTRRPPPSLEQLAAMRAGQPAQAEPARNWKTP
jgi:hypothetical protein